MPSKTINMHGKLYDLLDEKIRVKEIAQKKAQEIRDAGQVAFLNPQKRKDKETNYWIYVADKTARRSSRKSVSSKLLLEEYKKGTQSFNKFMDELEKAQKPAEIKDLPINQEVKKAPTKAKNGKKAPTKAKNGKKAPSKAKNGKKAPKK